MNLVVTSNWITFYASGPVWVLEHRSCPSGTAQPYAVKESRNLADKRAAALAADILAFETGVPNVEDGNMIVIDRNNEGTFSVLGIRADGEVHVLGDSCADIGAARRSAVYYAAPGNLNIPFIKPVITKPR